MGRIKIDYGIDLGTTNSSICRMDKGEPSIIRTETLRDVMPSCVSFTRKGGMNVGDRAINNLKMDRKVAALNGGKSFNTFIEFKRTMGTDTVYHSDYTGRDYSSVDLSAEVLKALKALVVDEEVNSVVVTVPAKFTVNQKTATLKAAMQAGFKHCELLQEPVAAAMAYGLSVSEKNGYWMVFDFGGGTFDAALLNVSEGIIQVADTEGDNYLGGKNLDYAIVDSILLPHIRKGFRIDTLLADTQRLALFKDSLKSYAEEIKIGISSKETYSLLSDLGDLGVDDDGEEIEIDLTVSREEVFNVIRPYFQKAVDICLSILERNSLIGADLDKIILVGGPTRLPLVAEMLDRQISSNVDTSVDPMTAVATGAALYASTLDAPTFESSETASREVRIQLGYEPTTVETMDWVSLKLLPGQYGTNKVYVKISRGDGAWSSDTVEVSSAGRIVTVDLKENAPNLFNLSAFDKNGNRLPCTPQFFTILQGTRIGRSVLPYSIGISVWKDKKNDGVFMPFTGLEKNRQLPATGILRGRYTTSQLRPGMAEDILNIPVYQADAYEHDTRAYLYEWVADVIVTGEDVPAFIPRNSRTEVTLKVDTSEQMTMEVYFPDQDITVEKSLDTSREQSVEKAMERFSKDLSAAYLRLYKFENEGLDVTALKEMLAEVENENRLTGEIKAALQHLKEVLRKIEDLDDVSGWNYVAYQLKTAFRKLETAPLENPELHSARIGQFRQQVEQTLARKDEEVARQLIIMIDDYRNSITLLARYILTLRYYDGAFKSIQWTRPETARALLDKALNLVNSGTATEMSLYPYVASLYDMSHKEDSPDHKEEGPANDFGPTNHKGLLQ